MAGMNPNPSRARIAALVAVILFAVALVINVVDEPIDPRLALDLLYAGLAALALTFVL